VAGLEESFENVDRAGVTGKHNVEELVYFFIAERRLRVISSVPAATLTWR
jgi:hypothetical protein